MDRPVQVDCPIEVPEELSFGVFANAIRILPELGDECLLDFCVFSAQTQSAVVVSRLRIKKSFLPTMLRRLQITLTPPQEKTATDLLAEAEVKNGQAEMPDGRIIVFYNNDDETN